MEGWIFYEKGYLDLSVNRFRHALATFETTRQPQNTATLHLLISNNLLLLGDPSRAIADLYQALSLTPQILKSRWVESALKVAAETAHSLEQLPTSVAFLDEAVGTATQEGKPAIVSEALVARALAYQELANQPEALRNLEAAEDWLNRIKDPPMHQLLEAQFLTARGEVLQQSEPKRAIDDLTTALEDRVLSDMKTDATPLYLARGRAYLAQGESDRAENDFQAGIRAFEQRRRSIPEEQLRISYFDKAREVFDDMIALQADVRHDPRRALEFSERARARELLDTLSSHSATSFPSPDVYAIRKRLPSGLKILYYVVLRDEILAWTISRDSVSFSQWGIRINELQNDSAAIVRAMESDISGQDFSGPAFRLYKALIEPLGKNLEPGTSLVIVPDKFLNRIPFAALLPYPEASYLAQEHAIAISPSLSLFEHSLENGTTFSSHSGNHTLVMGNPDIDRNRFSHLPALPGSESEAKQIAAIYSDSKILLGKDATKRAFLDNAGLYEIVHFSGHAISNEEFPLLSQLVFAGDSDSGDGALLSQEIGGHLFPKTRLVVLAACSTAKARISLGEGALSLARPFIAAGVPAVVASLWDVDDTKSLQFLTMFHGFIANGLPVNQALHETQIRLQQKHISPRIWAAFEVIQGSSS